MLVCTPCVVCVRLVLFMCALCCLHSRFFWLSWQPMKPAVRRHPRVCTYNEPLKNSARPTSQNKGLHVHLQPPPPRKARNVEIAVWRQRTKDNDQRQNQHRRGGQQKTAQGEIKSPGQQRHHAHAQGIHPAAGGALHTVVVTNGTRSLCTEEQGEQHVRMRFARLTLHLVDSPAEVIDPT